MFLSLEVAICTKDEPRVFSTRAWRADAVDTFSIPFSSKLLYREAKRVGERQHE